MTRKEIIDGLMNRGYDVEARDVVKNGVTLQGIVLSGPGVKPVLYFEDMKDLTLDQAVDRCVQAVDRCVEVFDKELNPGFDVNQIQSKDFMIEHARIGMQRSSDEDIIRVETDMNFDGIDAYVYLWIKNDDNAGAIKVNSGLLEASDIDYDELVEAAKKNTIKDTKIESIAEAMGFSEDYGLPVYIVSNNDKVKGAGAILNVDKLKEFADKHGVSKLIALPSSVHEWLIIPCTDDKNIDDFTEMVVEVNEKTVDPTEQLGDKAYFIEV